MKKFFLKIINSILKIFKIKLIKISDQFDNSYRLVLAFRENKIDHIIDVGANEGQFAKQIRFYGYKDRITSFEPLIGAQKKLFLNSQKDKYWEVFRPVALGNKNSKNVINISKNSVSSSLLDISEEHIKNAPDSETIDQQQTEEIRLDDIFLELDIENKNLFLKIDTQGYEFQVLEGAKKSLDKFKGILVEVSLVELYEDQKKWQEIVDFVQSYGFKLWSVDRGFTNKINGKTLQMDLCFFK